jgi:hypothetical protein
MARAGAELFVSLIATQRSSDGGLKDRRYNCKG